MWAKLAGFFAGSWAKLVQLAVIISAVASAVVFIRQSGKQAERLKNYEAATAKHSENMAIRGSVGTDQQLLDELREGKF